MTMLMFALLSCKKPTPLPAAVESETLGAFFERVHQEHLAMDPIWAAYLGAPHDETAWTPMNEEHDLELLAARKRWLAELDARTPESPTPEQVLSIDLFRRKMKHEIEGHAWRNHGFPMTHISGTHTWIPSFLMTVHRIEDSEDAANWTARVRSAAPLLDSVIAMMETQAALGIRPPAFTYPSMIEAIDNLTTGAPFDDGPPSPLFAHFESAIEDFDDAATLRENARSALADDLGPAYARLRAALVEQQARQPDDHGAWALPDGEDYYAFQLRASTTTDRTPDAIHALGLREVARIQGEMRALMPALGLEGDDLQALYAHLREPGRYTEEDDDAGREAYLDAARGYVSGFEAVLPEVFEHLPEQPLEVRRVEEWREKGAGKAFYQSPSPDGSRPGIFYANLAVMGDMPTYQLEALVYHEGIPGHHMQNAVSQRLDDLPPFRRFSHYTAYGEGWGLYSERLPKELGFYEDPASDVGRLAMELWRAARLVVDTGIHDKKWTREQAIDYLVTETPNPRGDAVKAIERYFVWPGQATAYKIGMIEILRMREEARERMGPDFDLRGFHGVVLGTGPVPLDVLDTRVRQWSTR